MKMNKAGSARRGAFTLAALTAALLLSTAACSSPEQKLVKYTESGAEYLEKGDLGRANVEFQNALKINEDHIPALLGVSEIAERKQDFRNMFGVLQKVVRLDPKNVEAQIKLGKLYLVGSDEQAALEAAEAALALEPQNAEALALKAAVRLRLEDVAGAVELAKQALELDPTNPEAVAVLATERARAGDNEAALKLVETALDRQPEIPVLHLLRLQLLAMLERPEALKAAHRDIIALYPEEPAYRKLLVKTLVDQGDLAGAREELATIAKLTPKNIDAKLDVVRIDNRLNGPEAAGETFRKFVEETPDNVDLKFAYAGFLRSQKDYAGAEAIYKGFAAAKGDEQIVLRARNEIAALRLLEGKIDESKTIVDDILAKDTRNTEALIKRAGIKIEAGDFDGAIVDLRTVVEDKPDSVAAKVLMATAFERKGDIDFAKSQYAQAVADSKNDPNASHLFARLLMRTNDLVRAEKTLTDTLASHPDNAENLRLLAAVRLMRQDWRGAEDAAKMLEEANSKDPMISQLLGAAYTGLKDYSSAIDTLSAANTRSPLAGGPLSALVAAYVNEGRTEEAASMLTDMIESDADNYTARMLLAQVYDVQKKPAEMEATLRAAVERDPNRNEAAEALYRHLTRSGRGEEAGAMIDRIMASSPDNLGARVLKADYLLNTGKLEEAMAMYAEILEKRPGDLLSSNNYASLLSDLRDDEASRAKAAEVAKVLEGNPNPYFLDTLGWAQYRNGQVEQGLINLKKAVEGSTGFADAHYHLGAVYLAKGEIEQGRAQLEKAVAAGGASGERARELLAQN
ncbi:MAG: tetratricopeptide repeat protein [Amphiplicatus sp.]